MNSFKSLLSRFSSSPRGSFDIDKDLASELLEVGSLVKSRRESFEMTRQDLAISTRITTPVLEAIESGCVNSLPEHAYLVSMLPLLEARLQLSKGTLDVLLKAAYLSKKIINENPTRSFTIGNIDILTTWQGALLYFVVIIAGIYLVNYQQSSIAKRNMLSLNPVPYIISNGENSLIEFHREKPIDEYSSVTQATRGSKKEWLNLASLAPKQLLGTGNMKLEVLNSHLIKLRSAGGADFSFTISSGKLSLNLIPPVFLEINPPLTSEESVIWNGVTQFTEVNETGIYRFPKSVNKSNMERFDLPQEAPLSP